MERNRIRVALIFFACASVASVSTLVGQGLFASDTSSAGVQPTNSAEATAAAAENSLMAMYSPLPLNHSQVATPCPSGDCASAPLVRSFSNVPSPLSQAASDWSPASISKRINARRMIRRNDEVLNSLFATDISEKQSIYARAVANSEQEYADGQTSGCGDCTIPKYSLSTRRKFRTTLRQSHHQYGNGTRLAEFRVLDQSGISSLLAMSFTS